MSFEWGKHRNAQVILPWIRKQRLSAVGITYPMVIAVFLLMPIIIRLWLPAYESSIRAIQFILIGTLFAPFSAGWGNVLNIINKQIYNLYLFLFTLIINLGLNIYFVIIGFVIEGVAMGTSISFCIYHVFLKIIGKRFLDKTSSKSLK